MKKSVAVLNVITQMSIYKVITVLIFLGISQVAFVYMKIKQCLRYGISERYTFADYMDIKILLWIFMLAFLLINLILFWTYHEKRGVHTAYFYERISIRRNQKFTINMLYALFCYFLLYSWQIGISRLIELMIRSMTKQAGDPIYQYISGVYYADLLNGIYAMDDVLVLVVGILFLILFAIVVAKSEWKNNPPIGMILLFVLYAVTYEVRIYSYVKCVELIIVLSVCILYIVVDNRTRWKNKKNMG